MLREEYVVNAAEVHAFGTRFLRDGSAALLPCCTVAAVHTAFKLQKILTESEKLMDSVIELGEGLLTSGFMTEYSAVAEARMKLLGLETDCARSQRQAATERAQSVPPGRRAEVYEGLVELSQKGAQAAEEFTEVLDGIRKSVRECRVICAVPSPALDFLRTVGADYGAACAKLYAGEEAVMLRRTDSAEAYGRSLKCLASAQGGDYMNITSVALAAKVNGGLVPGLAPALTEILLCYEKLPATYPGDGKDRG